MKVLNSPIQNLFAIEPNVYGDKRGYFFESYNKKKFNQIAGTKVDFIQDNESFSSKGTLRGLHFQKPPFSQAKLVRVVHGEVLDVAVDLRQTSVTFGKSYSIVLSADNKRQLFVPRGFAHGFVVLSDTAIFSYKVDNVYAPEYDSGLLYNDKDLGIDWRLPETTLILSEKDSQLSTLKQYKQKPCFK